MATKVLKPIIPKTVFQWVSQTTFTTPIIQKKSNLLSLKMRLFWNNAKSSHYILILTGIWSKRYISSNFLSKKDKINNSSQKNYKKITTTNNLKIVNSYNRIIIGEQKKTLLKLFTSLKPRLGSAQQWKVAWPINLNQLSSLKRTNKKLCPK